MTSAAATQAWTLKRISGNVFFIDIEVPYDFAGSNWEFRVLLRSDVHHDNPKCLQDLEARHARLAAEINAPIIDLGDYFCAMQGKYDKRSNKSSVRPEHMTGDYLDALVREAADFNAPWAAQLAVIGKGNHETAIYKNHETDLTARLCERLQDRYGSPVQAGGYTNWVRFRFRRGNERRSLTMWTTHGYGGGGPVTKDRIQLNRQVVYVGDADIMASGHTHDSWSDDSTIRLALNPQGRVRRKQILYVKCPSYKDAYADGEGGFEIEKGHPPKALGAYWLKFAMTEDGPVAWSERLP